MYKKTIMSAAIASVLTLTGCLENGKSENFNNNASPGILPASFTGTYPIFDPAAKALPIPNDLIFQKDNPLTTVVEASDGTFEVADSSPPVTTALNELSGASTTAPIDVKLSGLIDATTVAGNVFLIALDYASGSPVQGLSIAEPPTIPLTTQPTYNAVAITLDGTSYIRFNPKTPLNPLTRYIVVITDGVKDINGDPLQGSPGVTGYKTLTNAQQGLANPALAPVRALINNLWEPIAVNFFAAAVNPARAAGGLPALTDSNIVLSYSLTTSGDKKVLNYIADPASWFNDQLKTFIGVTAAKSVVGFVSKGPDGKPDGKEDYSPSGTQYNAALFGDISADGATPGTDGQVNYADIKFAVTASMAGFPSAGISAVLSNLFGTGAPCAGTTGATATGCIGSVLAAAPVVAGGFADLLPTPKSTTVTFDDTTTIDINKFSSLTGSLGIPSGTVSVTSGTLTIPYYNGVPSGANGLPLITDYWIADDTLATAINTAFAPLGLKIPQADPMASKAVNYIFPFPKKTADETIPIVAIHPTNRIAAGTPMKTAIFQHGITTDRSSIIPFSASMVAGALGAGKDVTVIAIDQPLHGVAGISTAEKTTLATKLLAASGSINVADGIDNTEQASIDAAVNGSLTVGALLGIQGAGCPLGITNPADLTQIGAAVATVESGVCGPTAQATLAGAQTLVRTIANGGSTIAGLPATSNERHFNFTSGGAGVAPVAMNFSGSNTTNSSGSMFINLTSFLTSRDNLREQVLDLLTLRKSIAGMDLNPTAADGADLDANDVYFFGHSLGTVNGIPFVAVANTSSTTSDNIVAANFLTPGGGVLGLIENSPSFSTPVLAGLAAQGLQQDNASFHSFTNIFQATFDATDSISFVQDFSSTALNIPVLFSEVVGDTTIPNDPATSPLGNAFPAYLSGTEPLAKHSGAATIAATAGSVALGQSIVRYSAGFHSTPAFPSTGTTDEKAVFAEMVGQGVSMLLTNGAGISVTNTSIIQ